MWIAPEEVDLRLERSASVPQSLSVDYQTPSDASALPLVPWSLLEPGDPPFQGKLRASQTVLRHQPLDGTHVLRLEREVVDAKVLMHVLSRCRSGQRDHVDL